MDNYYLNNAVYSTEAFLESTDPYYDGEVDYGDRAEHCWNSDHTNPTIFPPALPSYVYPQVG